MNERPLRILMLIHRLADNSPYCLYVHERARALKAMGHEVTVISPVGTLPGYRWLRPAAWAATHSTPRYAEYDGIPVHFPRYWTLGEPSVRLLGGWPMSRVVLPIAQKLHGEKPFDIVHAHMLPIEGHAGTILGKALGLPVALTVHGTDVLHYFRPGQTPWPRNRAVANEVSLLMAVSGLLASRVAPYRQRPVEVLHNGVDLSLIPQQRRNVHRRLISGGTLKARKCMHTTLDAFSALAGEYSDSTLTIFGEGPDRASLEAKIAERCLEHRVTLTGNIPHGQVLQLMADSDAFVMPSYGEGEGIVYIEAMAAGCVAVGSLGEGITDTIRHGENGYLVPAADAEALIPVMRTLLDGGEAVEAVRARGMESAQLLTWAHNAERCVGLYRQAIAEHGAK